MNNKPLSFIMIDYLLGLIKNDNTQPNEEFRQDTILRLKKMKLDK